MQTIDTNLAGPDFHNRQLPEFRRQAEAFGTKLTALADQLRRRKTLKQELAALIASTNLFLRDVMDNAVNFVQDLYPDFYREYHLIRRPHERKRRRNKKTQPAAQETSLKSLTVDDAKAKPSPIVTSVSYTHLDVYNRQTSDNVTHVYFYMNYVFVNPPRVHFCNAGKTNGTPITLKIQMNTDFNRKYNENRAFCKLFIYLCSFVPDQCAFVDNEQRIVNSE